MPSPHLPLEGMDTKEEFRTILPEPWEVTKEFVNAEKARLNKSKPYAICAVPANVDTPCEELIQGLEDAIEEAKFPDDGEAGHVGETARTYVKGSTRMQNS